MEAQLSLGDVTKSVFTSDYSSNYKTVTAGSAFCDMLTTNTIKQSISVDSSNTSEIKESEYKIKEVEKIISKNILFSIYEFNINAKYSNYSYYLGQNIHTYEYTNLTNDEVPSFKKLHMYLDQISTVLINHKGIVSSKDTGNQLYHSLQEFIDEINDSSTKIYSLVMGGKIANVEADTFIISAERLFKGESSFKTKNFIGDKAKIAAYFNSVKSKYLDIANSVAGYNDGLQQAIVKFNKVMDALATEYKSNYSQVALQVEYKKEELRNVLYAFAMKYFNLTNILYSIKADCVHEYLNPSYSDYDNLLTIKEDYSLNNNMDFLDESSDLFEDDSMYESTRQVDFSFRTIELEEAFFAYTIKPLLENEMKNAPQQGAEVKSGETTATGATNNGKPSTAITLTQQSEQSKDKDQATDASKKIPGTADNLASADKDKHIDEGGKVTGFGKTLKELWNKIMNFMKKLMEKISFAVSKSKDRLMNIINDFESVKKINENLNNSDDEYTFRVYNADLSTTAKRINTVKLSSVDNILQINNDKDVKNFNATEAKTKFINKINSMNGNVKTYFAPFSDIKTDDTNSYYSSEDAIIVLKNYFAGNDNRQVKTAFNDIKNNTEGKAKNGLLASTLNIGQIKQQTIGTIANNIKAIRIDQIKNQCDTICNGGTAYINRLASFFDSPTAKAEAAKVTIESVMAEYFSDLPNRKHNTTPNIITEADNNTVDVKPVTNLITSYCNNYISPLYRCANFAYQQMCDNYYNILNALLSAPLKTNANSNNDQGNQSQQSSETPRENNAEETTKNK